VAATVAFFFMTHALQMAIRQRFTHSRQTPEPDHHRLAFWTHHQLAQNGMPWAMPWA